MKKVVVLVASLFVLLLTKFSVVADEITIQQSCDSDIYYNSFIRLEEDGKTHIAIQSSQIVINTSIKRSNGSMKFYFNSIKDLGRGGINIDWNNISRSKEVLTLKTLDKEGVNQYKIIWHGLYDSKAQKTLFDSLFQIEKPVFKACELDDIGEWRDYTNPIKFISSEGFWSPRNNKVVSNNSIPKFKDFLVSEKYEGDNHQLVLNDSVEIFSHRLSEVIKNSSPEFAGKYLIATWECGTNACKTGAIIDASTGEAFKFPVKTTDVWSATTGSLDKEKQELIFKTDSRLIIFAGNVETKEKSYSDSVLFYEFTGTEFNLLKVMPYGKSIKPVEEKEVAVKKFSSQFLAKVRVKNNIVDAFDIPAVLSIFDMKNKRTVLETNTLFSKYEMEKGELRIGNKNLFHGEKNILISADFNFDGLSDLAIRSRKSSCYDLPAYEIYLNKKGKLIKNMELTTIASENCGMFHVDSDMKIIRTMTKSDCCQNKYSVFKIENDKPIPTKIVEQDKRGSPFVDITTKTWSKNKETTTINRHLAFEWDDKHIKKVLSFSIKDTKKKVLLFIIEDALFYTLLKKDGKNVEFSYPHSFLQVGDNQWYLNDDTNKLSFKNDGVAYEVYEEYKDNKLTEVGVRVVVDGEEHKFEGDINSIQGNIDTIIDDITDTLLNQVEWRG